ncbi:hypothetical protein WA158_000543 [Blastocystis sp. Blastoise]
MNADFALDLRRDPSSIQNNTQSLLSVSITYSPHVSLSSPSIRTMKKQDIISYSILESNSNYRETQKKEKHQNILYFSIHAIDIDGGTYKMKPVEVIPEKTYIIPLFSDSIPSYEKQYNSTIRQYIPVTNEFIYVYFEQNCECITVHINSPVRIINNTNRIIELYPYIQKLSSTNNSSNSINNNNNNNNNNNMNNNNNNYISNNNNNNDNNYISNNNNNNNNISNTNTNNYSMINDGNTVLNPPSIFTSSPTNNVLSTNIQQNPSDFTHRRSSSHIQPSSETFNCQEILSIYPGECIPIPLVYSYQSFEFMIRPKQEGIDSEWSDPISIDSIPEMTSESRLYTVLKNNNITKEREKMNLKVDTQTRTHGKCKRIQSICLKKNEEKQSWYCYLKRKFTSPKVDNTESIHTSHAAYIYRHTMDIVLTPAYIIHNNLPLPLNYAFYGPFEVLKTRGVLKSEESEQVYIGDNATDVMYLRINIEGYRWSHDEPLHDPNNPNGHIVQNIKLEKCPFAPNTMSSIIPPFVCCMKYDIEDIYIYSHYMLTNYTSMPLKYRWGTSESLLPPINPIPAEIESDGIDYYNNFHYYKIAPDDINNILAGGIGFADAIIN